MTTFKYTALIAAMTTTAFPALAEISFDIEGEITAGYNSDIENNSYLLAEGTFEASQSFDNGFGWALSFESDYENFGWGVETDHEYELLLELITPIGTAGYGYKDTASETFFADTGGMDLEVREHDDDVPNLRWMAQHGNLGYAISTADLTNDDGDDISVGLGFDNGTVAVGLAYDFASDTQDRATGMSVGYAVELANATATTTLSHIDVDGDTSSGIGVVFETETDLMIEAGYAVNSAAANAYAIEVEYEHGPLVVEAEYEKSTGTTDEEFAVDIAYTVDGFTPGGTTFYLG